MLHTRYAPALLLAAALTSACTLQSTEPPLPTGPSEMSLSLTITATPDVIFQDGGSQSLITIVARDANGQPVPGVILMAQTSVNGTLVDYGTLSAKSLVTDGQGRATVIYTSPSPPPATATSDTIVRIVVTPVGGNYDNTFSREVSIRLSRPGVINPPNGAPVASFFFAPVAPSVGTEVLFDASGSRDSDGRVVTYQWNWGDGDAESTTSPTIRKDYEAPGTFNVRLTVVDDSGASASASQTITVGASAMPTAAFVFSPASPAINEAVHFDATASAAPSGRAIVRYEWTFGDGTATTTTSRTTTKAGGYAAAGDYVVTLRVTDSAGLTAITTQTVTATTTSADGPTAEFTFSPTDPHPGTEVTFDAKDSIAPQGRTIVLYEWNFGDTPEENVVDATGRIVAHTYDEEFTYTVTLTVTDNVGRKDTVAKTVTVDGGATAAFTISPTTPTTGTQVHFDAAISSPTPGHTIQSYHWNYGDGTSFTTSSAAHTKNSNGGRYAAAGTYTVTLTVTDSAGNTHTTTNTVTVN